MGSYICSFRMNESKKNITTGCGSNEMRHVVDFIYGIK